MKCMALVLVISATVLLGLQMILPVTANAQTELVVRDAQGSSNPALGWGPQDATPGVEFEMREIDRRKKSGVTEVTYQILIEGAPKDKIYNLWLYDLGMMVNRLPPARLQEYRIDASGNWHPPLPRFTLDRFRKGEWGELRLVSIDGSVKALGTMVPFPIEATEAGCKVSLRLISRTGDTFFVIGKGFEPGEKVETISRSNGEVRRHTTQVEQDGLLPPTYVSPEVADVKRDHKASYTVSGPSCNVTVNYEWGTAALKIQ